MILNRRFNAADISLTPRSRVLILNSPSNPTGGILEEKELREIAELVVEKNLVCISDEIYEYYVFDGNTHTSMASLPGMRERTITMNSFSEGISRYSPWW